MSSGEPDFKQLGNAEFRKGAFLKAAALYTKGLKLDPGNAVLLRSVPACACKHMRPRLLPCSPCCCNFALYIVPAERGPG